MYELQGNPALMSIDPSRGRNPQGGRSFYVREGSATGHIVSSDDNEGTDPQYPLNSIQAALDKCVDSIGDYVFVLYHSTILSAPITIPKRTIHLIAVSSGNFDSRNDLNGASESAIKITSVGRDFELAGFNIGGAGADYGIEVAAGETMYRCHIHHCTFGNNLGVTDGIHAAEMSNMAVDHCLFGSAVTGYAINCSSSVMLMLLHNLFHDCSSGCIYLSLGAVQNFIMDNTFGGPINGADGWAIDLPVSSSKCLVMGNRASECGDATQGAGNPYRDRSANSLAAKLNMWADNKAGNAFGDPKATV